MFPRGDVNHTCCCSITHSLWARKAACTGLGILPCYSIFGSGTPRHPRSLDWRVGMKHYSLSRYHHAPLCVWNLFLFLVQPSPLRDLQLTAYKPNATDCILPVCCEIPLMSLFPMWGFFSRPSEFQGTIGSSWSKSTQRFPCTAEGIFKAVSGFCSSTLSFGGKHKECYHTWSCLQ